VAFRAVMICLSTFLSLLCGHRGWADQADVETLALVMILAWQGRQGFIAWLTGLP
jgi:hypothetical protein